MADTKITALTAITTVDPAVDVLPIVDVSDTTMAASGTTKKITSNQILGSGGTATLASATITGDLTVDTSTLKVDSANDRVGIGTATPGALIEAYTNTNGQNRVLINNPSTGSSAYNSIDFTGGTAGNQILSMGSGYSGSFPYTTGALVLRSGQVNGMVLNTGGSAAPIVFGINDSEAMRLNSTGLGVGASPVGRLNIANTGADVVTSMTAVGVQRWQFIVSNSTAAFSIYDQTNSATRLLIDTSGNVGVGGNASVTGIDTGVARLFVVAPNSNTGMAATFIADSVGRGLLVADQGKTNSFGVEVVAGLVKTGGFTSGTSVALFANAVERARVKSTGQVRFVPLAADPSGAEAGDVYYNSSSNKLKCYNGSTWNDLF